MIPRSLRLKLANSPSPDPSRPPNGDSVWLRAHLALFQRLQRKALRLESVFLMFHSSPLRLRHTHTTYTAMSLEAHFLSKQVFSPFVLDTPLPLPCSPFRSYGSHPSPWYTIAVANNHPSFWLLAASPSFLGLQYHPLSSALLQMRPLTPSTNVASTCMLRCLAVTVWCPTGGPP